MLMHLYTHLLTYFVFRLGLGVVMGGAELPGNSSPSRLAVLLHLPTPYVDVSVSAELSFNNAPE